MKREMMLVMVLGGAAAHGAVLVVEPDNYADGTVLNNVTPGVTFSAANSNNVASTFFTVTANTTQAGFQSTGTKAFGETNVDFWDSAFRMRMDFVNPVQGVSIDAIGGTNFNFDVGVLETYGTNGVLLHTYETAGLAPNRVETMSVLDASADISYAVAYGIKGSAGSGPFLGLDHLVVNGFTAPEPATLGLMGVGGAGLLARRRRSVEVRRCR